MPLESFAYPHVHVLDEICGSFLSTVNHDIMDYQIRETSLAKAERDNLIGMEM